MFPINFNFPYRKKDGSLITMEKALDGAGADLDLIDLDDVAISSPADGDGLIYDNTAHKWKNIPIISRIVALFDAWQKNGAYNILNNTATTQVVQTVTYTVNPDNKTVVATWSSAPSGSALLQCSDNNIVIKSGTYKLVGCPSGGAWEANNYKYKVYIRNTTDNVDVVADLGSGVIFTADSSKTYVIYSVVGPNAGASGSLTFKPMITTDLNATYDDYVPYAKTNQELTSYTKVRVEDITWIDTYIDSTERYTKLSRLGKVAIFVGGYVKVNAEIPNNTKFATLPVDITEDLTQLVFVGNQKAFQVAARTNHTSNAELYARESIPAGVYMLVGTILIY